MNRLIKNELIKIFRKKSIYITLFVILVFVILTNCIYKFFYRGEYEDYSEHYIQYTKEELARLDPNKPSDKKMYIELKSQVEVYDMKKEYEADAWQRNIIATQMSNYINEKNTYLYGEEKAPEKVEEIQEKIQKMIEKLKQDDWKYFAEEEYAQINTMLSNLEEEKQKIEDKQELQSLEVSIENAKIDKQVAQYRIDKNIKYANDYKNRALETYQSEAKNVREMEQKQQTLSYEEKQEYHKSIKNKEISQYIIENEKDIHKQNDLRGILQNFFSEYGLFIIVMIVMIAGTIVSEEFNKGTIKLLLVKPYSRNKILLSKLITVFIMIVFSILAIIIMELVVGGIIFGYDSLSVPMLIYNFNTQSLESMHIFTYLGIQVMMQLPKLILLATLAFTSSSLFTNGALAITIPLLGYMSADVINMLVVRYKVEFMRLFVSLNWEFEEYLFGNLPKMEGMTAQFSIVICILYFVAMLIPTFICFKKKNIKNI